MKGTIISFFLGGVVFWSLSHNVFNNFFKIKRQRIYKPGGVEDTDTTLNKVSNAKNAKTKRRNRTQPPTK